MSSAPDKHAADGRPASRIAYVCQQCGEPYPVGAAARYCASCGAKVTRVGRSEELDDRRSPVVMLVDDSAVARHKVASILRSLNCQIVEATDGPGAMKLLESTDLDLVVLDVNMPRVTGLDVLERIRSSERLARIPVVMLTGEADGRVVTRAIALKANDYVRKDDSVESIRSRLKQLLEMVER